LIVRLLLALALLVLVGGLLRLAWLRSRGDVRTFVTASAIAGGLVLLLFLVVSGRLHWLYSIPAALIPFASRIARLLGFLRLLRGLGGGASTGASPGSSRVETALVRMHLDHETGELDGEILEGPEAGRRLGELGDEELLDLLRSWRRLDHDSARLLETYLDRTRGDAWRAGTDTGAESMAPAEGRLGRDEALAILGLGEDADRDAIVAAHRRLMQQFHPDRGGSDYLAALVNRARARLLEED
jgi:hypothetical protein